MHKTLFDYYASIHSTGTYRNEFTFYYEMWVVNQKDKTKRMIGAMSCWLPDEVRKEFEKDLWGKYLNGLI